MLFLWAEMPRGQQASPLLAGQQENTFFGVVRFRGRNSCKEMCLRITRAAGNTLLGADVQIFGADVHNLKG